MIEKHFTLDKTTKGPDHLASLEPYELIELVKGIRIVKTALGSSIKKPVPAEQEVANSLRRSVVAITEIPEGIVISEKMLAIKRPGNGIAPKYFDLIVGRVARRNISANTLISWDQV